MKSLFYKCHVSSHVAQNLSSQPSSLLIVPEDTRETMSRAVPLKNAGFQVGIPLFVGH